MYNTRSKRMLHICMLKKCTKKSQDKVVTSNSNTEITMPYMANPGYIEVSPRKIMGIHKKKVNDSFEIIGRKTASLSSSTSESEQVTHNFYNNANQTLETVSILKENEFKETDLVSTEIRSPVAKERNGTEWSKTPNTENIASLNVTRPCYILLKNVNNSETNNESVYSFQSSPLKETNKEPPQFIVHGLESIAMKTCHMEREQEIPRTSEETFHTLQNVSLIEENEQFRESPKEKDYPYLLDSLQVMEGDNCSKPSTINIIPNTETIKIKMAVRNDGLDLFPSEEASPLIDSTQVVNLNTVTESTISYMANPGCTDTMSPNKIINNPKKNVDHSFEMIGRERATLSLESSNLESEQVIHNLSNGTNQTLEKVPILKENGFKETDIIGTGTRYTETIASVNESRHCHILKNVNSSGTDNDSIYSFDSPSFKETNKEPHEIIVHGLESSATKTCPMEWEQVTPRTSEETFHTLQNVSLLEENEQYTTTNIDNIPDTDNIKIKMAATNNDLDVLPNKKASPLADSTQQKKISVENKSPKGPSNTDRTIINFGRIVEVNQKPQKTNECIRKYLLVSCALNLAFLPAKIKKPNRSKVQAISNCRPWTKKNICPYCMCEVTHFPRHLTRNHSEEGAVKELLTLSKSDKKRKKLLDSIRRQGNYVSEKAEAVIRPIRRPRDTEDQPVLEEGTYLACDYCLGYFKRAYIRRHRIRCSLRNDTSNSSNGKHHLSKIQMFTVCSGPWKDFYDSLQLKHEVFPIMRNDEISKAAMGDVLICSFGESQLKKHKRTQIKNVISNKLREMGRLLIELKKTCGAKQLFDILKPEYFDNFVAATKVLSGFDINKKTFDAGSLALHMGTNLKYVCDAATKLIIKKSKFLQCENTELRLKEVKRLKALVQQHWNTEISSIALKDLNQKNWEKPKLLPLTSDLMIFQKYVMNKANGAFKNLKKFEDINVNYRILTECVLALTLLLNRKRVGEIQFLKASVYCSEKNKDRQSELIDSLTESEKILSNQFLRVVTGGKGSKPVPILFPANIQNFIGAMLSNRDKCVSKSNEYLFANPKTENRWLSGYHILRKLADESGVSNKELITSTRLRKQIASVIQVLNIDDAEMEQFAKFMGHTKKTHEEYYRLPQDVYQTAKVSKILLAINRGKTAQYKGKKLEDIELSDNLESEESDIECDLNPSPPKRKKRTATIASDSPSDSDDKEHHPSTSHAAGLKNKKETSDDKSVKRSNANEKCQRIRFTEDQKLRIKQYFKGHINKKIPPKKKEVEEFMKQNNKIFSNKNWVKIKAFVFNCYKK